MIDTDLPELPTPAVAADRHLAAIIVTRVAAVLFVLLGAAMAVGGISLALLGGSLYYILAGFALFAAGLLYWRGRAAGSWLMLAIVGATLAWGIAEAGMDGWALLARLGLIVALGIVAALAQWRWRSAASRPLLWRLLPVFAVLGLIAAAAALPYLGPRRLAGAADAPVPPAGAGDWAFPGHDAGGTRFSPLVQITPANVSRLAPLWTYRTGDATGGPKLQGLSVLEATPIQLGDTLYLCTQKNAVVALDAETGRQKWRFDPQSRVTGVDTHSTCRGLAHQTRPAANGPCATRIFHGSLDARLWAIDALTGRPCPGFGQGGSISLREGLGNLDIGYHLTSPGAVGGGLLIVGAWISDNQAVRSPSGVVRAFDVLTGKLVWAWDMGHPERVGAPPPGETYTPGTPNVWAAPAIDERLGLVYLPTGNPTPDLYGGNRRPFDERYGSAIVALDLKTGRPRWSFQTTRHDVWDYDIPAQPVLADIPTPAGVRPALIQATKRGDIFVLDRRTGAPILPVTERNVPQGGAPGERIARTQPFSAISVRGPDISEARMWGMTPVDQLWCRIKYREARYEGLFTPPGLKPTINYPGSMGVMNWGGVTVDTRRHLVIANSSHVAHYAQLIPRAQAPAFVRKRYRPTGYQWVPMEGTPFVAHIEAFLSPLKIPCNQPPWGRIQAFDLATGKRVWQRRLGTARDSGPLDIPIGLPLPIGVPSQGGAITTASGLTFIAATADDYLRAFDARTGAELWRARLPAGGQATPMTYRAPRSGRQIVLVAAGGHAALATTRGDHILAFALPR